MTETYAPGQSQDQELARAGQPIKFEPYLLDLIANRDSLKAADVIDFFNYFNDSPEIDEANVIAMERGLADALPPHHGEYDLRPTYLLDRALDRVLGVDITELELDLYDLKQDLRRSYIDEELWLTKGNYLMWSGYMAIRSAIHTLELNDDDMFYDLGSGYGRVSLYAGMVTSAECRGIELLPERAAKASETGDELGLDNVSFTQGNVLSQDYSDGTAFYMYSPFSHDTKNSVLGSLRDIATEKTIRLVCLGSCTNPDSNEWLERTPMKLKVPYNMYSYISR